jgi:hypothetical protein
MFKVGEADGLLELAYDLMGLSGAISRTVTSTPVTAHLGPGI